MIHAVGPLRVALFGYGRIAERAHLPALSRLADVEIAAVAEADASRRSALEAVAPGATRFAGYGDLLERGGVDAAVICLPPALHADAAVAAFERGLHVYLEKPLATTTADASRVLSAWRRAGTIGRIGFNFRFHPLVLELRRMLLSGALGEVVAARTIFSAAARRRADTSWRRRDGGGALLDLASHHVDLVRFLFGQEVAEVAAFSRSLEADDDAVSIELRLAAGPLVGVFVSVAAVEEDRIEVYGTGGGVVFDRYRSSRLRWIPAERALGRAARVRALGAAVAGLPRALRDAVLPPPERSYSAALASFVAAARGGGAGDGPHLEDGLKSLEIVAAAARAAASGRRGAPEQATA